MFGQRLSYLGIGDLPTKWHVIRSYLGPFEIRHSRISQNGSGAAGMPHPVRAVAPIPWGEEDRGKNQSERRKNEERRKTK